MIFLCTLVYVRNLSLFNSPFTSHIPSLPQKSEPESKLYSSLEAVSEMNLKRLESSLFFFCI
jgi:hypothetical protein